jgi:hypothetical protein
VESRIPDEKEDAYKNLNETITKAMAGSWLTKGLRADSIQILVLTHHMIGALRTGRMRWSLQHRSHYEQASRLCFLIEKGRGERSLCKPLPQHVSCHWNETAPAAQA